MTAEPRRTPGRSRWYLSRVARGLGVAMVVSLLSFGLVRFIPGDPVKSLLGEFAAPELEQEIRTLIGLDGPLHRQFTDYYGGVLRGDLGTSVRTRETVASEIGRTLPVTLSLVLFNMLLAALIGVPLSTAVSIGRRRVRAGQVYRLLAVVVVAIPAFVTALFGIYFVGVRLGWLPVAGYDPGFPERLRYILLPALVAATPLSFILGRVLHTSIAETSREEYVEAALGWGLPRRDVVWHFLLRPSLPPTINLFAYVLGQSLAASVILETVFNIPGIGNYLVAGVLQRDYPVVQGTLLVFGLLVVVTHTISEIVAAALDPRMTQPGRA